MFRNRTFKVLGNLILLVVLYAGQVAAAPNNSANEVNRNPSSLNPSIFVTDTLALVPEFSRQALMAAGETIRVSVDSSGVQGNDVSLDQSISADGRYVVFFSSASNLVSGDTNSQPDVFVRDTQTNAITRISVDSSGVQANWGSWLPKISADGQIVAFASGASNLVANDTNHMVDIFVHNRMTGQTIRVSVSSDGIEGDDNSGHDVNGLAISANGRYVAFGSYADNLVTNDTHGYIDTFVHDLVTGETKLVSGIQTVDVISAYPSLSADGRYIAFFSNSSNLVSGDTNGMFDVFVRDIQTNTITRASLDSSGVQGNSDSTYSSISANGRYVAFYSDANNLVSGDTNGKSEVFVRDIQMNTTTRVSLDSSGVQGNDLSQSPSISADGRFVAFGSSATNLVSGDTNWTDDVFVRDTQTNTTTRVSIASNGIEGNWGQWYSGSWNPSISADGRFVAFYSSATNLVSGDTNYKTDVFVHKNNIIQKSPLILVHGFQGLSTTGGYPCSNDGDGSNDIQEYDGTNPALSTMGSLPDWFLADYRVYIAHLESTPSSTPSLITNAQCLSDQIDYVASQNPNNDITIVAHSMGGLVSRAALYNIDPDTKVKALYTLGSPHGGFPSEIIPLIWGLATNQTAVYNMSEKSMDLFNGVVKNKKGVQYNFIGGDGTWGGFGPIALAFEGFNDGLVGKYSAMGWDWPLKIFVPFFWANDSVPGQYWTNEFHVSEWGNSYYSTASDTPNNYSHAFECMNALMNGTTSTYCQDAKLIFALSQSLEAQSTPSLSAFTELKNGHLNAGQSLSIPLEIDTDTASMFYLTWSGNTPAFTLTRPDAQVIDPAYAIAHPSEITYENFAGGAEVSPNQTYNFNATQSGNWQLNITTTTAIDYQAFAVLDSSRSLTAQTNADLYQIGDTATITADFANGGTGLNGATVTAKLTRPDAVVDTISLTDQGNGTYTANYVIPNSSGYLTIEVTASGTDGGTAFTRQNHLQVAIQSDNLQLTGVYSDTPNDGNSDGFYEKLDFAIQVNLASAGEYAVTADLYAGSQFVTQFGDFFNLTTGTQTITLPFDGVAIRQAMLNGPYTITNLSLTPLDTGITAQSATNVITTSAYSYTQFGVHPCYLLTLGHSGSGGDPVASPANSTDCNASEYTAGESIDLTASPVAGWQIGSWTGTGNNAITSSTNTVTMPASDLTSNVNYSQIEYSLTITSVNGTVAKNPNQVTYHEGDVVQLTATSNTGWSFANWAGGLTGSANPGSVTIRGNTLVTANYTLNTYSLSISKVGTGNGTVTSNPSGINCGFACSYAFAYNTIVTLTAMPTSPSTFGGWTGSGCSGTGTCIVTMSSIQSVTATFNSPGNQTLTVSKNGTGSGTVASSPAGISCGSTCSSSFATGTVVTLTAAPTLPSTFGGWTGGGCFGTGTCTVTMSSAKFVTATFNSPGNQTLTVSKNGTGSGIVASSPAGISCGSTCSSSFASGTIVTLTAMPTSPSTFGGWTGGGCSGTGTCTVTMSSTQFVTATFNSPGNQTLTVSKNGTGSGTVASSPAGISCGSTCSYAFTYNSIVTLTASPISSFTFGGWSGAGCSGTGNCTVTLSSAQSITATFNTSTSPIFADVPFSYWASSYIERLYNAGITGGCGTGLYCPDNTVTRAQMAVFLLKGMHGSSFTPPPVGASTGFTDVDTNYWAAPWIKQLATEGITGGCGSGNYCPDTSVTRAQMAIFLLKAKYGAGYTPSSATGIFTDVEVGYWADKWIEQLAAEGITGGCGAGIYCPEADVTRAQMAVFLVKDFNLP